MAINNFIPIEKFKMETVARSESSQLAHVCGLERCLYSCADMTIILEMPQIHSINSSCQGVSPQVGDKSPPVH
jgi:hypothetical protein